MTAKDAKEYLRRIKKIDTQLKNKNIELKQAQEVDADVSEIREAKKRLEREKSLIISSIESLPEAEYDVLHRVYVQGETLYEVASDMQKSYSYATKRHGWALQALERIINK